VEHLGVELRSIKTSIFAFLTLNFNHSTFKMQRGDRRNVEEYSDLYLKEIKSEILGDSTRPSVATIRNNNVMR